MSEGKSGVDVLGEKSGDFWREESGERLGINVWNP